MLSAVSACSAASDFAAGTIHHQQQQEQHSLAAMAHMHGSSTVNGPLTAGLAAGVEGSSSSLSEAFARIRTALSSPPLGGADNAAVSPVDAMTVTPRDALSVQAVTASALSSLGESLKNLQAIQEHHEQHSGLTQQEIDAAFPEEY